ncbi:dihydrodipicolinate reductase [Mariniphaga anaerophila]|uniref:4-hydroxy-tetrahydrodipicolinate reductase n=1 Tax=Mariniphaga anaerophila TaxID=1484053 RepID=A0A1M4XLF2_9BACT|nr:4-hydroxy-tetrahydrodipicolinate reductase [Mariniphaga anaerophila]SHE94266.1 dihydrodipicolinate reductase [Mariniphaga anaerophila]
MKLALIGYGKMGKEIEKIAVSRGHKIELIIDINNQNDLTSENLKKCDVAIEFTIPGTAVEHYMMCFEAGIPVVSGTTGWLSRQEEVHQKCKETNGTFFYGSNFSVGVNLFFELNRKLADIMASHPEYKAEMTEVHHTHKLDAPSGTAISLAEDLIDILPPVTGWAHAGEATEKQLPIKSIREGEVPGIHTIKYDSDVDYIEITHSAKSRKGFALGAVLAAEYSLGKKGILTMKDMLKI